MPAQGALSVDRLSDTVGHQIRGLLAEYGIVLPHHVAQLRRHLPALLEDGGNELTIFTPCLFHTLYEELVELETKSLLSISGSSGPSERTWNASESPLWKAAGR